MWTFLVYNDDIFVLNKTEFVAYVEIKVGNTSKRCIQRGSWSTWFFYILRKHIWLKVSCKGNCYKLKHQRTSILFCLPKVSSINFCISSSNWRFKLYATMERETNALIMNSRNFAIFPHRNILYMAWRRKTGFLLQKVIYESAYLLRFWLLKLAFINVSCNVLCKNQCFLVECWVFHTSSISNCELAVL